RDLLWHFPARYEDFSQIRKIAELEPGEQATIRGTVDEINLRRTWRRNLTIVEAMISDESGTIRVVWFNQPYIASTLRVGRLANFAGKVSVSQEGDIYLSHPAYELIQPRRQWVGAPTEASEETRHTARLVPIYPETRGLTSKGLRFLIQPILKNVESLPEWIPSQVLKEFDLPEINRALATIHFPKKIEDALEARKRFAFEDLFLLQLYNLQQKIKLGKEKALQIKADIPRLKELIAKLPFELTLSQKKSLWEIVQDILKPTPMNRLLQGEVGSGKTVVAALAAIMAAENNLQAAFMAPTEILAHQHFETLKNLLSKIGAPCPTGFLAAGGAKILYKDGLVSAISKQSLREKIKSGEVKIAIGTHALISEKNQEKSTVFNSLALVIIDEQHRFGVEQRAALLRESKFIPHLLSMSATPIPRTLMLTIFGDLDISTITELPAGRKNIVTKIVPQEERKQIYDFIRKEIEAGRQAFVICPRIAAPDGGGEPSPRSRLGEAGRPASWAGAATNKESQPKYQELKKLELKSVKEEYEKLSRKIFPDLKIAMLHGQLKSKDKEKIMKEFFEKKTNILISTSVVEVGVDIQNATIMMIEGSDRFGLAQLYQFRGRVGRGEHQSYCFLLTNSKGASAKERLKAIIEAKNGFELAEKDLKIRGPGEFLGESQTGLPDIAMRALQDTALVKSSREAAHAIIQTDANLKKHPMLKAQLNTFEKGIHLE
ncbi:MAG: ATP-dependent DNA helicase RecG, partial [bacterium]|nr:ATP-dependent DNA helicase RecG [bacterium]